MQTPETSDLKALPWREQAREVGRLHTLQKEQDPTWTAAQTAKAISFQLTRTRKLLYIYRRIDDDILNKANSLEHAYNILYKLATKQAEEIVSNIAFTGANIFSQQETPSTSALSPSIICTDFCEWIKSYSSSKFNLLHCDFPYEKEEHIYWQLLSTLVDNLNTILSYSAHVIFWLDMSCYSETIAKLQGAGLVVNSHPLIWLKSGASSATTSPKHSYSTALFCTRGNRPLTRSGQDIYSAPIVSNKIHPDQQSEPMLRFFLSMVVNETTSLLDPTCGSGAAVRAVEALGAKAVLGLELNPTYAASAVLKTLQARALRQANISRKEDMQS